MTASQEVLHQQPGSGLRSRKKHKTRLAIQDAALELFAEQGFEGTTVDQIAARAEVSTATFFRYFKVKSDVVFGGEADERAGWLPALERAILERPRSEDDLTAARHAILQEWVPLLDSTRLARQFQAVNSSPLLRGLSTGLNARWQDTISRALAHRRQLDGPDHRCRLTAAVAQAILTNTLTVWAHEGSGDLAAAVEHGFELMVGLCAEWSAGPVPGQHQP